MRRSLVTKGFTKVKCRLVKLLQDTAPAGVVAKLHLLFLETFLTASAAHRIARILHACFGFGA